MKVTVMNDEDQQVKYISVDMIRRVLVRDNCNEEIAYHNFEWKINTPLGNVLDIMKRLYSEARYDYDKQEKRIDEEPVSRIIAVGRKFRGEEFRLHPLEDFWQHADPLLQIEQEDVCLSLLTPHYRWNCHNLSYLNGESRDLPLCIDDPVLKKICRRPIKEGVNRMELSAYSNISEIIAELIVETSSAFTRDDFTKAMLTRKLDQLLAQYPKPQKLN